MTEKVTIKDLTCKTCTRKKIQDQEADILISWYCIPLKMEMGYPDIFWEKKTDFVCPDCGYVMTDEDHKKVMRKECPIHMTEMNFFTCPGCGKEAIVLW